MLATSLQMLWAALPVITWIGNLSVRKRVHPAILYFATGVAGYVVLLVAVWAVDAKLEAEMNAFDLNGDGSFSGAELTPAAERAMEEWSSDTGRTFAPIFGVPITAIWYTIVFAIVFGAEWLFRICFLRKRPPLNHDPEPNSNDAMTPEDGNPYRPPNAG